MLEPDPPDGADASYPANRDALAMMCQSTEIDCVEDVIFVENNNSASQEVVVGDIVCDDTSVTVLNDDDAAACVSIPPEDRRDESLDIEMRDHEGVYDQHETTAEEAMGSLAEHSYVQPDNREPLSPELQHGQRILKEIMSDANKSVNWPFIYAVDDTEEGLEDYYERVKQPMWLQKMYEKFETRDYKSITEFVADFRLMLENCYRYNGASHQISKKAQRLEIVLEQKLTLLSRALREKTSIDATSGHALVEQQITGTRRRVVLTPHDSSLLLNQIRQEEQERQREQRRLHIAQRKNQQEAYLQELQAWEDILLADGRQEQLNAMWEIAQIGHFLFLCAIPLNLGEIIHYELERCFLMPRESSTMQRVMTFLISTPYQRTRLENKPVMPYSVWEEKLQGKLCHWYKTLTDNHQDINKTIQKLGLEEKFFHVLGMKNPMEKKKYHELTFYQRVWVMKSLCDVCLETQQSIRDGFETQPIEDQHAYVVGHDADGNSYLHFPQFCGADLRIYRQSPIRLPKMERPPQEEEMLSDVKLLKLLSSNRKSPRKRTKKKKPAPPPPEVATPPSMPRYRDSRLRQNPKTVTTVQPSPGGSSGPELAESDSDSGISENEVDSGEPTSRRSAQTKHQLKIRTPEFIRSGQLTDAILARSWRRNHDHAESSDGTPTPSRDSTPTPPVWRGHRWKDTLTASRGSSPLISTRGSCVADPDSCASTPAPSVVGDLGSDSCCSMPAGDVAVSSRKKRSRRKVGWNRQRRAKKRLKVVKCEVAIETPSKNQHNDMDIPFDDSTNDQNVGDKEKTGDLRGDSNCQRIGDGAQAILDNDGCLQSGTTTQGKPQNIQQNTVNISVENRTRNVDEIGDVGASGASSKCGDGQRTFDLVKTEQLEAGVNTTCPVVNGYISDRSEVETKTAIKMETDDAKYAFIESHGDKTAHLKLDSCEIDFDMCNTENATVSGSCSEVKLETNNLCNGVLSERDKSGIKVKIETQVAAEGTQAQLMDGTGNLVVPKSETTLKVEKNEETPASVEIGKADQDMKVAADVKEESDEEMEEVLPDLREFELVVDGVDSLKRLVVQFAELEPYELGTGKKKRCFDRTGGVYLKEAFLMTLAFVNFRKLITPPLRKRCVVELHKRLLFLQKELEPWEHKLQQATKRARIKLKKEQETYKEAAEKEKVEDIWESEEEASGEEEEEEEEASDAESSACEQEPPKRDPISSQVVALPVEESQVAVEKSTRGRIRKRRLVGDETKDQTTKKRKKTESGNTSEQGTPQKLTPNTKASSVPVRSTPFTGAQNSILNLNLLNKHGVQLRLQSPPSTAGQTNLSAESATLLAQLSAQPVSGNKSPGGKTPPVLPGEGQHVIKALLSSSAGAPATNTPPKFVPYQFMTVTPSGTQPLNVVTTKSGLTSIQPQLVQTSSGPAIIVLPNANAVRQVSPAKVMKGEKTPVNMANITDSSAPMSASGPRFFHYNSLSELPPGLIQHILKTQDSRIKGQSKVVPAVSTAATEVSMGDKNALLLNLITAGVLPATASLPQCNLSQTSQDTTPTSAADFAANVSVETSSDTKETPANVGSPAKLSPARSAGEAATELTKTGQVNPELLARLSGSCDSSGLSTVHFSPQRAPKYASNVTVKTLLESRAAATQRGQDGVKDITAALTEVEAKQMEGNTPMMSQYNVTIKPTAPVAMTTAVKLATQPNPADGAAKVMTLPVTIAQQLLQPQLMLSAISQSGGKNPSVGALPQLCLQLRPATSAAVGHQVSGQGGAVQQLRFQLQAAKTSQTELAKQGRTTVQRVMSSGDSETATTKQVLTVLNSGATSGCSVQLQQGALQMSGQPGSCAVSVFSGQRTISNTAAVHPLSGQFWTSPVTSGQPITCNTQHLRLTSNTAQPTVSTGQQQFTTLQTGPLTTNQSPVCVVNSTNGHQSALTGRTTSVQSSVTTAAQHFSSVSLANILTAVQSPVIGGAKLNTTSKLLAGQQKMTTASLPGVLAPPRVGTPRGAAPQQVMVLPQGVVVTPQLLQQLASVHGQQPGSLVLQYGKGGTAQLIRAPVTAVSPQAGVRATAPLTQKIRSSLACTEHARVSPVKIRVPVSSSSRIKTRIIRLPVGATQPSNVHVLRAPGLVAVANSSVSQTQTNVLTTPTLRAPGLVAVPRSSSAGPGRSIGPSPLAPASVQPEKLNISVSAPSVSLPVATRGQKVRVNVNQSVSSENVLGTPGLAVGVGRDQTVPDNIVSMTRHVSTLGGDQVMYSHQQLARTSGLTVVTASSTVVSSHHDGVTTSAAQSEQNSTATLNNCTTHVSNAASTAQPTNRSHLSHSSVGAHQAFVLTPSPVAATVLQTVTTSPRHVYVQQTSPVKTVVPTSGTIVRLIRMQSPVKKGNLTTRPHPQQHSNVRLPGATGVTQIFQAAGGVQSPTKLVLYNVGGQLVTAQGIPVSLPIALPSGMTTARVTVAGAVSLPTVGRDDATVHKPQMLLATAPTGAHVVPSKGLLMSPTKHQQSTVIQVQGAGAVTLRQNHPSGSGSLPVSITQLSEGQSACVVPSGEQVSAGNSERKKLDRVHVSNNRTLKGAVCAADSDRSGADRKDDCVVTTVGGMVGDATSLISSGETGLGLLSQAAALQQAFNTAGDPLDDGGSLQTS